MQKILSFDEFTKTYQVAVNDVFQFWTADMQAEIAAHNPAWGPGKYDFKNYLKLSDQRFYKAYRAASESDACTLCDVASFWGVFPLTMLRLGFKPAMTEALKYYSNAFDPLFGFLRNQGLKTIDYDPFHAEVPTLGQFDFISVMAVLEHYPYSLKIFMGNIKNLMHERSRLLIEVPNIAYYPKRLGLLLGKSPLPPVRDIFESKTPFIGHHHEFSYDELNWLGLAQGLKMDSLEFFNYSNKETSLFYKLRNPVETLSYVLFPKTRECMTAVLSRNT